MYKFVCTNKTQVLNISSMNVVGDTIFTPQSQYDSTLIQPKIGASVCGDKAVDFSGATFYVFGGVILNDEFDMTFKNDIQSFDVTFYSNIPIIFQITDLTSDSTSLPPSRIFATIKKIGSYIYVNGGLDQNMNILSDSQRYSLLDNTQLELSVNGTAQARIFDAL